MPISVKSSIVVKLWLEVFDQNVIACRDWYKTGGYGYLTQQMKQSVSNDVVLYIYNLKHQACTEKESLELECSLNNAGYKELEKHFTVLGAFDWPD